MFILQQCCNGLEVGIVPVASVHRLRLLGRLVNILLKQLQENLETMELHGSWRGRNGKDFSKELGIKAQYA
uniref:Uncharacterized protein n=1 Tax=Octopus bimaculoides TaxID=37653 RepID=A0A0L8I1E1_OCTBM